MDKTERAILNHLLQAGLRELSARAGAALAPESAASPPPADEAEAAERAAALFALARQLTGAAAGVQAEADQAGYGWLPAALATLTRPERPAGRQHSARRPGHPLAELALTPGFLLPEPAVAGAEAEGAAYARLHDLLAAELAQAAEGDWAGRLTALKRCTWAVPATAGGELSLYEQLRTAAGLAVCLHRAAPQGWQSLAEALQTGAVDVADAGAALAAPVCWLVKGDLSGVQDFLYLLTSAGAARGLRGRSFYLQLLTETLAGWVLHEWLGESEALPLVNLLYAGGGHFYLLLPPAETAERWDAVRRALAERLWRAHAGDLGCTLAYVPVTARELLSHELGEVWGRLAEEANRLKQRKWLPLGGAGMFGTLFQPQDQGTTPEKMCQVCHNEWDRQRGGEVKDEVRKCGRCIGFERLGHQLRDVQQVVRFQLRAARPLGDALDWQAILAAFGVWVELLDGSDNTNTPKAPEDALAVVVERVNEFWRAEEREHFAWPGLPVHYGWRLVGKATPLKRDRAGRAVYDQDNRPRIAEFSDLAEAAAGAKWLGVLRMDVDDLGEVLRAGLQGGGALARLSTLSESLRLFFEGRVPQLCAAYNGGKRGDRVYLIYAGGDDLFVVGAWSVLPQLARQIQQDFERFVGGKHVTVSAGIAIEHAKYPLYQLAAEAGHALDAEAKEHEHKDAISFLGQAVSWERFATVESWQSRLIEMLADRGQPLPRSFLTRLGEIYSLYASNAEQQWRRAQQQAISFDQLREERHFAQWLWRAVYHLGRFRARYDRHQQTIHHFQQALTRDDEGLMQHLRLIARWAELQTRENRL